MSNHHHWLQPFKSFYWKLRWQWINLPYHIRRWMGQRYGKVTTNDFTLWVSLENDLLGHYIYIHRNYEPFETQLFKALIQPNMVIVDIGANIGYYTLHALQKLKNTGLVIAFEPENTNFDLLQRNILLNNFQNVRCEQYAVGDQAGESKIYLSTNNYGDHRTYETITREELPRASYTIKIIQLDRYLEQHKLTPQMIKIDIQGSEVKALRGMSATLAHVRSFVLIEFWPYGLRLAGDNPSDLLDAFRQFNYQAYEIVESDWKVRPLNQEQALQKLEATEFHVNLLFVPAEKSLAQLLGESAYWIESDEDQ